MRRTMLLTLLQKWQRTLLQLLTMLHIFECETSNSLDIHTHMLLTPRCSFIHLWGWMPSLCWYTSLPVYPSAHLPPLLSVTDIHSSGSGTLPCVWLPSMHCRLGSTCIMTICQWQRQYLVRLCWRPIIVG